MAVRGRASRNSTDLGALKCARWLRQWAMSSVSVTSAPARTTTSALMASPHLSSGTPMTATSATAECLYRQSSTSIEDTFSPPVMMTSFLRSDMTVNAPSR